MDCDQFLNQVCDELSEDINAELCTSLEEHLQTCEHCRNIIESMQNTVKLFRCLEADDVPEEIHKRLLQLLNVPDVEP